MPSYKISLFILALLTTPGWLSGELRLASMAYTFGKNDRTFYEAIESAAKVGTKFIEIAPGQKLSPMDPTSMLELSEAQIVALKAYAQEKGVTVISLYTRIPSAPDRARARFEYAKRLGVQNITTESYAEVNLIEKLAVEFDLTVAFHAHAKRPQDPTYWAWNPHYVFGFLQGRDERLGVCAETGHWATSGFVSLDMVRLFKGRIKALHLKERSELGRETPDRVYGTGINQIGEILRELAANDPGAIVIIEYESNPQDNLAEVSQCVEFVRKTLPGNSVR